MRLCYFEVSRIGPTFRDMTPPFSRCHARLGLAEDGSESVSEIRFNIVYAAQGSETLDTVKSNLLAECLHLLREGVHLLEGKTVQSFYEITDAERKRSYSAMKIDPDP